MQIYENAFPEAIVVFTQKVDWHGIGQFWREEGRRSSGIPRCASADFITQGFTGNHALLSDQEESMVLS